MNFAKDAELSCTREYHDQINIAPTFFRLLVLRFSTGFRVSYLHSLYEQFTAHDRVSKAKKKVITWACVAKEGFDCIAGTELHNSFKISMHFHAHSVRHARNPFTCTARLGGEKSL